MVLQEPGPPELCPGDTPEEHKGENPSSKAKQDTEPFGASPDQRGGDPEKQGDENGGEEKRGEGTWRGEEKAEMQAAENPGLALCQVLSP